MRVIVPYVPPAHARTIATVDIHAPEADWVDVSGSDQAYYRLLAELWASGEDFMLVEHDMELLGGEADAFTACRSPWCTFPYEGSQPIYTSRGRLNPPPRAPRIFRCALGCTRFRAELTAELPDAVAHMARKQHPWGDGFSSTHWRRLDSQLASYLFQHGHKVCEHQPHVIHHHDYDADPVSVR